MLKFLLDNFFDENISILGDPLMAITAGNMVNKVDNNIDIMKLFLSYPSYKKFDPSNRKNAAAEHTIHTMYRFILKSPPSLLF